MINQIRSRLFEMQDLQYREFHKKLIPDIDENAIIGVRTPVLRAYAKELIKEAKSNREIAVGLHKFMESLPHCYYEENNLHAFLLETVKDFDESIELVNKFLPCVDNWATCDSMSPKAFKKNTDKLLTYINIWISDEYEYTVRFGIGMLMKYYLDDFYKKEYLDIVSGIHSDKYYINMMIAWFFATALAKQYDDAVSYLEDKKLSVWVHNKAVQKAIESYRVSMEHKQYLKTLKIK